MTPEDHDDVSVEAPQDRQSGSSHTRSRKRVRKQLPLWQETFLLLGIALVLAIVIKAFFVQAFYIPSESMEPGLIKNDRILVQKVSYWFGGSPSRGDVIVFKDPGGWLDPSEEVGPTNPITQGMAKIGLYPTGGHLVKRVIGVGGDHVVCCDKQGRITVNGQPLDEQSYLPKGVKPSDQKFDVTVPAGKLWVMGDNRNNSRDSRAHLGTPGGPFISTDEVVGKVFVLLWPAKRFTWIHRPDTFSDVPDPS